MPKNKLGGTIILGLVALNLLLWLVFPPLDDGRDHFRNQVAGEMLSTSALILMAAGIFLSTRPKLVEPFFGGLDKMYRTHRMIAIAAAALLFGHFFVMAILNQRLHLDPSLAKVAFIGLQVSIFLALAPRIPYASRLVRLAYHRWRVIHRLTGLFFIVGILHSQVIDNVMQLTRPVYFYVLPIAFAGAGMYVYKELVEPMLKRGKSYRVEKLRRLPGPVTEVTLTPRDGKINHRAGQFIIVRFPDTPELHEPHPFTVSSAPGENRLRLSIKASGDFTRRLVDHLVEGAEARIEGGYGMFDYRGGAPRQIWVAGGIELTPFLSWIRDFNLQPGPQIDFFYAVRSAEAALFMDEIEQAQTRQPGFHFHLHCSNSAGRLGLEKIVASSGPVRDKEIYLCGPVQMIACLKKQFLMAGAAAEKIHYEEFSFR